MSFHTTIARLREAAANRIQGEAPATCSVQREDLRAALHVIDRLDGDIRRISMPSLGHAISSRSATSEQQAAAARLTKLAHETRAIYGRETCAGGEPAYPTWTDDVLALAALAQTSSESPAAGKAVRNAALEEAAKRIEDGSFLHEDAPAARLAREAAKVIRALKAQADPDGGDCAKGEGDNLVQQFIDATDALLASQERKTWTSGYKKELTAGERIRIAERWRQIRAALAAHRSPDADGGGRA
jgi:hypothetical protein